MAARDTQCITSTCKNVSGVTRRFSFLPPHGKQLEANEEYTVDGDLVALITCRFEQATAQRYVNALKAALNAGDLTIVSTPSPILYDVAQARSQVLKLDNTGLFQADPCFSTTVASDSV